MRFFLELHRAGDAFGDRQRDDEAKFPIVQSITRPAKIA
jgi:hypothetical protein